MRFIDIIEKCIPMYFSAQSNKAIEGKIDRITSYSDLEYMKEGKRLPYKQLMVYDENIRKIRVGLEDKLKTTLISVSLVMTMMTIILSTIERFFAEINPGILTAALAFMLLAVLFNAYAIIQALGMLFDRVELYQIFPVDQVILSHRKLKEKFCICIELNSLINSIRNNKMYVCSRCIINSIVLFFLAILIIIAALLSGRTQKEKALIIANTAKDTICKQRNEGEINSSTGEYQLLDILRAIQESNQLSDDDKAKFEWTYFEFFEHTEDGKEKRILSYLYRKLTASPEFFCEMLYYGYPMVQVDNGKRLLSKTQEKLATRAWKLLWHWHGIPGSSDEGVFQFSIFKTWFDAVVEEATISGHLNVALITIGKLLCNSPIAADLWIDKNIASLLDEQENDKLRVGYFIESISRGIQWIDPTGEMELNLAKKYDEKAEVMVNLGYVRFASTLGRIAEYYRNQARYLQYEPKQEQIDDDN